MRPLVCVLALTASLATATPAGAWAWSVHRLVAFRAMAAMAGELPLTPGAAWPVLWRASVAPDRQGPGRLPPQDHVFHVTSHARGKPFGNAPRRIQELTWKLMSEDLPDDQVVFELGRLSHLVADLAQPLHTDGKQRNPDEPKIHPRFEKDADHDGDLASVRYAAPTTAPPPPWSAEASQVNGWESRMEAFAHASSRDYDAICRAYARGPAGEGPGYPAVRAIARRGVERAIAHTVELWRAILQRRGRAGRLRRESASWAYVAVPFVLLWFVIRGRVSSEEARWPGSDPDTTWDRHRSDRAFRDLEARLGLDRPP